MSRLYSWMLNAVYLAVIFLASPWILWSAWRHGKYREGFAEKLWGHVPARVGEKLCVWLHAVSVGEVNLLATTLKEIAKHRPQWEIVISTTTKAGYDLAKTKYAANTVFYCPLDFSWATARAMQRVRPDLLILAELELWPNLIAAAKANGARVAIINGRLSDKSFRGYRKIRRLVGGVLAQIDMIAAQNADTAERFLKLGARKGRVSSTGSLKFDGATTDRENPRTRPLRELAGFSREDVVFLAGSTQSPEEEMSLRIFKGLLSQHPHLKLVIVPRHPQRFDEVAQILKSSGLSWSRRSEFGNSKSGRSSIILVDTIGELGAWWGMANIGFVGGSFGDRGGQNMLEPAAYGVATCFGPNTWNFRDIVRQLLAVDGAVVVGDEAEFAQFVRRVLEDSNWSRDLGERARRLVIEQQGATERTVNMLLPLVEKSSQVSRAA